MLLEVNNIEVVYNEVMLAIKGISLAVPERRIVALLGSNGAGKTTTLKAISGLLKPENGMVSSGSITYQGRRIDRLWPEDIVRLGIVQVLEGRRIFDELTVEENLVAAAYLRRRAGTRAADSERVYAYFPILKDRRRQVAGYLSGGEQQMLAIGRALMLRPQLLLLDEPSLGLSPLMVEEVFAMIQRIHQEEGCAVLVVEQNAHAALAVAQHGYVMENGKMVLEGPVAALRENRNVQEFYLGLSTEGGRKNFREVKHYKRRKRWFSS